MGLRTVRPNENRRMYHQIFIFVVTNHLLSGYKSMKKTLAILLLSLTVNAGLMAQYSIQDSAISTNLIFGSFSYLLPGGDMATRYGSFAQIGPGYMFKTRSNWILGIESNFMFGDRLKNEDNILKGIITSDGNVIDLEGTYADYHFFMRGFSAVGRVGKVVPAFGPNPNSGILVSMGGGYVQHKIRIEHKDKTAPQIIDDYAKGYDELKEGFVSNLFLGYLYLSNNNKVNFFAGIDVSLAFTRDARPYSFSGQKYLNGEFIDTFTGIRAGWIFPVYRRAPREFYYY